MRLVAAPDCRVLSSLLLELALKVRRKRAARGLLGDVVVIAKLVRHSLSTNREIHAGFSQSLRFSKRLGRAKEIAFLAWTELYRARVFVSLRYDKVARQALIA